MYCMVQQTESLVAVENSSYATQAMVCQTVTLIAAFLNK